MSMSIPVKAGVFAAFVFVVFFVYRYLPAQDILPVPGNAHSGVPHSGMTAPVSEIRVFKSKRYMDVISEGKVIRRYAVRLGFSPEGHKTRQGDGKTPEGRYLLDWRNPNSMFYKSFHVSYPNEADKLQAQKNGVSPGGDIMIHGSFSKPESLRTRFYHYLPDTDWTHGCIAVSNAVMDELWVLLDKNKPTPIEIVP